MPTRSERGGWFPGCIRWPAAFFMFGDHRSAGGCASHVPLDGWCPGRDVSAGDRLHPMAHVAQPVFSDTAKRRGTLRLLGVVVEHGCPWLDPGIIRSALPPVKPVGQGILGSDINVCQGHARSATERRPWQRWSPHQGAGTGSGGGVQASRGTTGLPVHSAAARAVRKPAAGTSPSVSPRTCGWRRYSAAG